MMDNEKTEFSAEELLIVDLIEQFMLSCCQHKINMNKLAIMMALAACAYLSEISEEGTKH